MSLELHDKQEKKTLIDEIVNDAKDQGDLSDEVILKLKREKREDLSEALIKSLADYYSDQSSFETQYRIGEKPDFTNPLRRNPGTYEAVLRQDEAIIIDGVEFSLYDIIQAKDFAQILKETKKKEFWWYVTMRDTDKAQIEKRPVVYQMTVGQMLGTYYYNRDFLGKEMSYESWRGEVSMIVHYAHLADEKMQKNLKKQGYSITQKICVYTAKKKMQNGKEGTLLLPIIIDIPQTDMEKKEQEINELFNESNVIFKVNSAELMTESDDKKISKDVEKVLKKVYGLLKKYPKAQITLTGYFGGTKEKYRDIPIKRAEAIKEYLVKKGVKPDRINTIGGKEQISQTIQVNIFIKR